MATGTSSIASSAARQQCPETLVNVVWADWAVAHLLWPLGTQLALMLLLKVLVRPLYMQVYRSRGYFRLFVQMRIGTTNGKRVPRPGLLLALRAAQIVSSFVSVTVYLVRTYNHSSDGVCDVLLVLAAAVDFLNWLVNRLRAGCLASSLLEADSLVDALTLVPTFRCGLVPSACAAGGADWLSLHFLRSCALPFNLQLFLEEGMLQSIPKRVVVLIQLALRLLCLIFVMAGIIFTCELLGDPPNLSDVGIETAHGDKISIIQMFYWIVVSLTTVGYGDFAPKALISRVLTALFIVYGICNIFVTQFTFIQLWSNCREGSGTYHPWRARAPHIVVVLGVRGRASQLSSVLAGFLHEVLHPAHLNDGGLNGQERGWPNVVLLSPSLWEEQKGGESNAGGSFEDFLLNLSLPAEARQRVWFIVGSVTDSAALERAAVGSSALTFILTDVKTQTPDEDDGQNIYTAMLVRQLYPMVRMRVMLVRPESRNLAVQSGVEHHSCFSARELTAHMLAQNVRCHGLPPMLTGLFKSWDLEDVEQFLTRVRKSCQEGQGLSRAGSQEKKKSSSWMGQTEAAELMKVQRLTEMVRKTVMTEEHMNDGFLPEVFGVEGNEQSGQDAQMENFWMLQYFDGLSHNVYGFALSADFEGDWFGEAAHKVFRVTGAILLGTLESDRLQICPQNTNHKPLRTGQICFAVATCPEVLEPCTLLYEATGAPRTDWREDLMVSRDRAQRNNIKKGTHVAAARVMGHQIRKRLGFYENGAVRSGPMTDSQTTSVAQTPAHRDRDAVRSSIMTAQTEVAELLVPHRSVASSQSGMNSAPLEKVLEIRRGLKPTDELTVVVVCHGEVWQQVRTFVESLRAPFQPGSISGRPVIILAPTMPPAGLIEDLGLRTGCLSGSSLNAEDLVDAGVLESRAVVVMSGENPGPATLREPLFRDCRAVLCAQELECWCGFFPHEVFTAYELHDSHSVEHLPEASTRQHMSLQEVLAQAANGFNDDLNRVPGWSRPTLHASMVALGNDTATPFGFPGKSGSCDLSNTGDIISRSGGSGDTSEHSAKDSVLFNSRFAAGQVLSPEVFGTMLGRMFYMPAVIELVEAILMPHLRKQKAFIWQIRVPTSYIGLEFGELFRDLCLSEIDFDSLPFQAAVAQNLNDSDSETWSRQDLAAIRLSQRTQRTSSGGMVSGGGGRHSTGKPFRSGSLLSANSVSSHLHRQRSLNGEDNISVSAASVVPIPPPPADIPRPPAIAEAISSATSMAESPEPRVQLPPGSVGSGDEDGDGRGGRASMTSCTSARPKVKMMETFMRSVQRGVLGSEAGDGDDDDKAGGQAGEGGTNSFSTNRAHLKPPKIFRGSVYSLDSGMTCEQLMEAIGPAVPMALYRPRESSTNSQLSPGTGGHNFSLLAPRPKLRLNRNDWVTVMGSRSFGAKMHEMGLLRGSGPVAASRATINSDGDAESESQRLPIPARSTSMEQADESPRASFES